MKILVGECTPNTRQSLQTLFAAMNQQVEFATAGDFDHALSLARDGEYSLIVLDRALPGFAGSDGLQALNRVSPAPVLFSAEAGAARRPSAFDDLTRREQEVLDLVADGLSNKHIARALDLQEVTVKAHLRQVFRKLGVANRTQAASLVLGARKMM